MSNEPMRPSIEEPAPGRARRGGVSTAAALLLGLGTALAAAAGALAMSATVGPPTTAIDISIRYSHYTPSSMRVPAGTPITVVLHNEDPIDHEWIIGDAGLHERHRTGTEPYHASRPTEVTIPAGQTITTVVTLPAAIGWTYVCHLPGHEAYGMVGSVEIVTG